MSQRERAEKRAAADTRIVYGARCVWWGSIHDVGLLTIPSEMFINGRRVQTGGGGLPCCPHCRSPLLELPDEATWWRNVDAYIAESGDEDYRAFIEWLRGKCYPSLEAAREAWRGSTS